MISRRDILSFAAVAAADVITIQDAAADESQAVEHVVRRIWERFAAQDPRGMLEMLHPTATIWDVFQPALVTRRELDAYVGSDYAQSAARGRLTYTIDDVVTTVWGDAAICRFYLGYAYEPPNPIAGRSRNTCVLRKFPKNGWLVVHVHEGEVPTGIPPVNG